MEMTIDWAITDKVSMNKFEKCMKNVKITSIMITNTMKHVSMKK